MFHVGYDTCPQQEVNSWVLKIQIISLSFNEADNWIPDKAGETFFEHLMLYTNPPQCAMLSYNQHITCNVGMESNYYIFKGNLSLPYLELKVEIDKSCSVPGVLVEKN